MAETIRGINVVIGAETTGLQKALSDVNKKSRGIQSELRKVDKLLKLDPKNTELLAQKQKLLSDAVATTKEKLDRLKAAQKQVKDQFAKGEISEGQYRAFQREITEAEQKLKTLRTELGKTKLSLNGIGESMQKAGKKIADAGSNLTKKVTLPIAGIGAAALKVGIDFEAGMSEVKAISGATGEDFEKLKAKAEELGANTKFSASEAASGLKYMAMAGWDTKQMLAGIDGVMMLAAASGEDLGLVSDIVTDSMTAFGLAADQAGKFADILAAASSKSNTNVAMLGESFKYVAPVAGALGYSAEDTAVALGLMANAGIKASQSGTSLRSALTNLASPTKEMKKVMSKLHISITDNKGKMKSLDTIMRDLRKSFGGLTKEQQASYAATLFGKEAMSGMLAIINTSEADYNKLSSAIYNSKGAAKDMSDTMQDNAKGGLTQLKSALEGLGIKISNILIPVLNKVVDKVRKMVDRFSKLDKGTQEVIVKMGLLAAAVGPAVFIFGKLVDTFGSTIKGISSTIGFIGKIGGSINSFSKIASLAVVPVRALGSAFMFLAANPVGLAITAIAGLTAAGVALYNHLQKDAIPEVERFGDEVSESTQKAVGAFMDLNDKATVQLNELAWSGKTVSKETADSLTGTFKQMGDQIIENMDKDHAKQLKSMEEFFAQSSALTDKEEIQIIANMKKGQEDRKKTVQDGVNRILGIIQEAADKHRAITEAEWEEIGNIRKNMQSEAIQVMSESEVEQRAILERMKQNASALSAQQAAEVVQNSVKQKDETIAAAEKQYNDVVKNVIRQRDETGKISAEQADAVLADALRQKEQSIANAKEMHDKVVAEAKKQAGEHVNAVNWETGETLSNWEIFKKKVKAIWDQLPNIFKACWESIKQTFEEFKTWIGQKWDEVCNIFKKTSLFEAGSNIIKGLKRGMESESVWGNIKNIGAGIVTGIASYFDMHSPSRLMMKYGRYIGQGLGIGIENSIPAVKKKATQMAQSTAKALMGKEIPTLPLVDGQISFSKRQHATSQIAGIDYQALGKAVAQHARPNVTMNNTFNSPTPLSPAATARQNLKMGRQLGLELGLR
ncbi:phage tail tape measure protein [Paenibacillus larvae]|uniref:Phage tail tape measure protein n=2 Tax=Paenibacillus larvae TaxID=1464 RepID=A0AAP5JWX8_9BACL|nr:phage tail tape measure protein [Paenibacillus larvae]ETK27189.1 putative phage tail tape measure protein [Paenibacillus larvae subsp. larvae DSM 25719]MCY9563258.1 phage tail tape measure protein [Paenibacillus larvae]MCY9569068.1 phage tail tape measure protein [Paenibacillus larvae]MCY9571911.1 phage tail tape measure protein [Paenibacillus larvae]MCY9698604.1 phage tail tape measure protein [Paenibacillus larvae]